MCREARTVFHDRAAAVAHRTSRQKSPPPVVIKNLRRSRVRLVKSGNDSLACGQQYVAGESSGIWAVKVSFRQRVLESRRNSQALELTHLCDELDALRTSGVEIHGHKNPRDRNLLVFDTVQPAVLSCVER